MLQFLMLLLLFLRTTVAAATHSPQTAEPYLSIWEDKEGQTEFSSLDDERFVPATAERLNAGYTSSVIWLRLDLNNTSAQKLERYFEIELDTISLFDVFVAGQTQAIFSGGQKRPWNRIHDHRHPVVEVSLAPHSQGTWYIRLQSNYSLCMSVWLHSAEGLAAKESTESLIIGTYTGLIIFAILLSIYVFISTGHHSFLYFAAVLLTYHLAFQLINLGLGWIYLWPDATSWADRATFVTIEVSSVVGIIFFRYSLELPRNMPWLERWLWVPLLKCLICLGWCLIDLTPQLVSFSLQWTALLLLFYYGAGIYLWRIGYSPAKFSSLAWLTVIVINVLSILQATDLVIFNSPWFRSAVRFELMLLACALQAGFLAIAIGDQFQQVQKNRETEYVARRKLEKNLDDAHVVQEAFIPNDLKTRTFEIVSSHHPSAKIGGDWLGYHHDLAHQRLILAIADVTGHGLPAALLSGAIHGAFHGLSRAEELDALAGPELLTMLMQKINDVVCMTATNTSLIATMVILSIDLETGRMDYINAGHTPLVLVRDNHPHYILEGGSPLGLEVAPSFGMGHFEGRTGDTIFLYTDGLLENARSSRRLQLHHLSHFLNNQDPLTAIQKNLDSLAGPDANTMDDDCSFIICRLQAA